RGKQPDWRPGGALTELERKMLAKARDGELFDPGDGPTSLVEVRAQKDERTVRAAVLRHLLIGKTWPVDVTGVRLRGVSIKGRLDLEGGTVRCPLLRDRCYLDSGEPVCLDYATVSRITLTGCELAGLTGDMLTAKELDLTGSTLTRPLRLLVADITGHLICSG